MTYVIFITPTVMENLSVSNSTFITVTQLIASRESATSIAYIQLRYFLLFTGLTHHLPTAPLSARRSQLSGLTSGTP